MEKQSIRRRRPRFGLSGALELLGASWVPLGLFGSEPGHFQLVVDMQHSIDPSDDFLGHLFLKIGVHDALEDDVSMIDLASQFAMCDVGAALDGRIESFDEGGIQSLHGHSSCWQARRMGMRSGSTGTHGQPSVSNVRL
jgi:hypothetical protein